MLKKTFILLTILFFSFNSVQFAQDKEAGSYEVGISDILEITMTRPEQITITSTVAPDGNISFPYIGSLQAKGMTLTEVQQKIEQRLADGYMKYPVVTVYLKESRSRKFFVYGEVINPGTYPLEENITVLKAISIAGGFTKYGSSSKVKVLRQGNDKTGYEKVKINIKAVMEGDTEEDIVLKSGDIVVVSEGVF